jgi:SNF2 family DNA or RNA helicase
LIRLKHYEHQFVLKKDVVNTHKLRFEYYKNAIDKIEKITNNGQDIDSDDVCAICLSEHQDPIAFFKKCGHYYCKFCIDQVKLKSCPICRKVINSEDILYVTQTSDITLGSKFVQLINQLKNTDEQFIIFTQFSQLIVNIKYALDKYLIDNITFDELFESKFTKKARVIIMSSDTNASGVDELAVISNMIIFEPQLDYSYGKQIEKQLIGRIRRVGQPKSCVNVYRYYVCETIEEKIYL